jgi:hypothetical protein
MKMDVNRREFLQGASAVALGLYLPATQLHAAVSAPTSPVAVAKCTTYGPEVVTKLATIFDQLGGLQKLVAGKTVTMKINMTGSSSDRFNGISQGQTYWAHPQVVTATVHLLGKAGARRIRLVESPTSSKAHTLEEFISQAGWLRISPAPLLAWSWRTPTLRVHRRSTRGCGFRAAACCSVPTI